MKKFRDHFSKQSSIYKKARPSYPEALFDFLANLSPHKDRVWDVACGNGQASLPLAERFKEIIATDASKEQIDKATNHPRINYICEPAEDSSIDSNSIDLITIATGLHWFDIDRFWTEAKRVLKPGGHIALWSYYWMSEVPKVDKVAFKYGRELLKDFWPPQNKIVWDRYQTISFPFDEIKMEDFISSLNWNAEDLLGFWESWSATQRYKDNTGENPIDLIRPELYEAWGDPTELKELNWKIAIRVGKFSS